ncbi:MAG: glycosyltransferase family 2 protein [Clostridia bacterium]|nr:glycosyltransferase family 2 protein [Clostridia bacterium]
MRIKIEKILYKYYYYSFHLCNGIYYRINNKKIKMLVFLMLLPTIVLKRIFGGVADMVCSIKVKRLKKAERNTNFDCDLSIVAIAKNEGSYVKEWLAYHKLIGVKKVFLYDNNSTDNLEEIVKPYIDIGFVEYHSFPGEGMQLKAYNDAINRYNKSVRYMAIIDCDEFLVPINGELLPATIKLFEKYPCAGGIGASWCVYGSSGKEKAEDGLVVERFTKRGIKGDFPSVHYKTIINPRLVKEYVNPHFPIYKHGAYTVSPDGRRLYAMYNYDVCFDGIVCNHYFCKSKEEFIKKVSRGLADKPGVFRDMSIFDLYDKNDIEDRTMLKYIDGIKQNIKY